MNLDIGLRKLHGYAAKKFFSAVTCEDFEEIFLNSRGTFFASPKIVRSATFQFFKSLVYLKVNLLQSA
jgi:hypothetical protein